jgi:hypothetical protein
MYDELVEFAQTLSSMLNKRCEVCTEVSEIVYGGGSDGGATYIYYSDNFELLIGTSGSVDTTDVSAVQLVPGMEPGTVV